MWKCGTVALLTVVVVGCAAPEKVQAPGQVQTREQLPTPEQTQTPEQVQTLEQRQKREQRQKHIAAEKKRSAAEKERIVARSRPGLHVCGPDSRNRRPFTMRGQSLPARVRTKGSFVAEVALAWRMNVASTQPEARGASRCNLKSYCVLELVCPAGYRGAAGLAIRSTAYRPRATFWTADPGLAEPLPTPQYRCLPSAAAPPTFRGSARRAVAFQ